MTAGTAVFACSICGEPSSEICAYCTKDTCRNHRCARCKRCSDCCECAEPLTAVEVEEIVPAEVLVEAPVEAPQVAAAVEVAEPIQEEAPVQDISHNLSHEPDPGEGIVR